MAKYLTITFPEKCIGCELCVAEAQRQLGIVGLNNALIRVFKSKEEGGKPTFSVQLDPSINKSNIQKIRDICPAKVFTIEEEQEQNELTN
ncbi:MAG: hypothetical protein ACD_22C00100G0016 [uncultured bacterium]|nr:MAG: hypothetical protein ACD_22C00100G0016 [uncultured bacterium]